MREYRAHLPPTISRPVVGDRLAEVAACALLAAALVFGGGSRGAGDLVVHLVALLALGLGVMRWRSTHATRSQRLFLYWLLVATAVLMLQLVPLPASWFAALPPRAQVLVDLRLAGVRPAWLPMTLDVWGTVRALLAMMTLAAAWLLTSTLSAEARIRVLRFALILGVATALLGFAQAAAGEHSPLRPYAYHHPVGAIGSFANRNHFADLMAMLLPLALAFAFAAQASQRQAHAAVWYALALLLFLASALSFSRAGMMLTAAVTVITSAYLAWTRQDRGQGHYLLPVLAIVLAASGVVAYAWGGIAQRMALDPLNDLRWQYLRYGAEAVRAYFPWGSGAGSFRDVYAPFEPVTAMQPVHALHAHNDVLEVALELGAPGLLLALFLLVLLIPSACRALRNNGGGHRTSTIIPATAIAVLVPLTHSFVDYPLRTLAVATVFATLLAVLTAPVAQRVE
ncbi:O-antigen ligase family protein [Lysobacter tyrosinilyticus]